MTLHTWIKTKQKVKSQVNPAVKVKLSHVPFNTADWSIHVLPL